MLKSLMASCLLAATIIPAAAQDFPNRTVMIIGSSGAGALTDVLSRAVGERLSRRWNQPVVIEARPGAAYAIAATAVSRAAPDGYTLIASELGMFTYQHFLYKAGERAFDGQKDFAPISGMAEIPVAVIAHPSLPVTNMTELVALARKSPGSVSYGTAGPGTFPHLSVLMLEKLAGVKLLPVHYRGVAPALTDVTAGHVNMIVMGPSIAIPSYQAGKLKFLGVGGDKPLPSLPDVPPVSQSVAGYSASAGFGLAAPAATPRAIIDRINKDVQEVLADREFQEKVLNPQSLIPIVGNADVFAAQLRNESQKWERVIREAELELK